MAPFASLHETVSRARLSRRSAALLDRVALPGGSHDAGPRTSPAPITAAGSAASPATAPGQAALSERAAGGGQVAVLAFRTWVLHREHAALLGHADELESLSAEPDTPHKRIYHMGPTGSRACQARGALSEGGGLSRERRVR